MGIVLAVSAGIMTWSFAEYSIHRWMGHGRFASKNLFGAEHIPHHSKGNYFAPWYKKLAAAAVLAGVLGVPAVLLAGPVGAAYVAGLIGFYLYYEVLHRMEHVTRGFGPYGRWARKHHFYHHFHNPESNHGVTSPLWDVVFGTLERPDVIRVPEKLKMRWLCDPATNEVWAELEGDYELRRPKRFRHKAPADPVAAALKDGPAQAGELRSGLA